ncbi:MAG: hypothetical protein JWP44_3862 [Mucilaginibacter sp.]|nr:hypothetical protein [Mucilaginibacter sp.]
MMNKILLRYLADLDDKREIVLSVRFSVKVMLSFF